MGSLLELFTQKYGDRKFIKEDRDVAEGARSAPPFQPRKSKQFSDTSCEKTHSVVAFSPKNCRPWIKSDSWCAGKGRLNDDWRRGARFIARSMAPFFPLPTPKVFNAKKQFMAIKVEGEVFTALLSAENELQTNGKHQCTACKI